MIASGYFSPDEPDRFQPIVDNLLASGDHYLLLADYAVLRRLPGTRSKRSTATQQQWTRKAILNVAGMGKFSSDRTIRNMPSRSGRRNP